MCTRAGVNTATVGPLVAFGAALWLLCAGSATAISSALCPQGRPPGGPGPSTFKSGTDLVVLNVAVTDERRRYVKDLSADDFLVVEDGVPQKISFFATEPVRLDVTLLLDTSSSMYFRLPAARRAAIGFIRSFRRPDIVRVVRFDDQMRAVVAGDGGPMRAEADVMATDAFGMTRLYDAIGGALGSVPLSRGAPGTSRAAIVVVSDGDDTASGLPFETIVAEARRGDAAIYAVVPQGGPVPRAVPPLSRKANSKPRPDALAILARETGGSLFVTTADEQFEEIYRRVDEDLRQQYSLAYVSSNLRRDGAFRRVTVHLFRFGLFARTRTGYFATPDAPPTTSPRH